MSRWRCGAVIIARDEEKSINKCLESLRDQTVELFLVVVNDGSADKTGEVVSKNGVLAVNLSRHLENWTGRPELARIFNSGFDVLKKENVDYVLVSGADVVYPHNYVEEIIDRMKKENIVLASGIAKGEGYHTLAPRGSGRILDADWFRSTGFIYPENYGFEVYHVYKALSEGRKVVVFPDVRFELSRGTKLSGRKMWLWGKGMKALNYWWLYALGRGVLAGLKNPSNGFALLKGYLSHVTAQYADLKEFVPGFQKRMLIKRIREISGRNKLS